MGLQVLDLFTEWLISQLLQIVLEKGHPRYCANNTLFPGYARLGVGTTNRLAWEAQQEPKLIRAEPECKGPDFWG